MRDQKVIKRKDGVNVCVYVSCFPLFSLVFCVSGCESKNCIVLEETTKAFISVGNNLLQSCLPSTGMNLKNLKKETVNWTNHNKAYNNNHHDTKTLSLWFIFATDTTTFSFYELMCLGIEMSFWIWSVSGNQRTKSNKSTQTSSPPHSDFHLLIM